jgi:hypothetical protein
MVVKIVGKKFSRQYVPRTHYSIILVAELFAYEENAAIGDSLRNWFFCKCSIAQLVARLSKRK